MANTLDVFSPIGGTIVPLSQVPDPVFSEKMLGGIMKGAEIHRYSTEGLIVKAGSGVVALHTGKAGSFTLNLRNGACVKCDLDEAETAIYDSTSGERIF